MGRSAATFVGLCVFDVMFCFVFMLRPAGLGSFVRNMPLWTAWGGVRAVGQSERVSSKTAGEAQSIRDRKSLVCLRW